MYQRYLSMLNVLNMPVQNQTSQVVAAILTLALVLEKE